MYIWFCSHDHTINRTATNVTLQGNLPSFDIKYFTTNVEPLIAEKQVEAPAQEENKEAGKFALLNKHTTRFTHIPTILIHVYLLITLHTYIYNTNTCLPIDFRNRYTTTGLHRCANQVKDRCNVQRSSKSSQTATLHRGAIGHQKKESLGSSVYPSSFGTWMQAS